MGSLQGEGLWLRLLALVKGDTWPVIGDRPHMTRVSISPVCWLCHAYSIVAGTPPSHNIWFSKHWPSGPMLSISQFVRPSVCLYVCLFTFEIPFNSLFAPTSQSRMSNIFTDSESLGKSNGKKWSRIWTFLFENCQKSRHKKKKNSPFFSLFFDLLRFLVLLTVFLPPLPEVEYPIFLEIRNPWGKVMERSGLRYEHFCLKIV